MTTKLVKHYKENIKTRIESEYYRIAQARMVNKRIGIVKSEEK